ncbi:hypothetical protein IMSHALPRED_006330 [Imshaugia aleurites]|uniref:Uncharacterized protein n=1 Tax=Imshaugia aleurites TaxID=172621 RepID=A0A8H3FHY3_9LECA|nr:hypothetical protein IMSHALPRED_006330 [Imshaugia aleurites]
MLLATTAPEVILMWSASEFFQARDLSKYLAARGNQEWTLTHIQFANAYGFWSRTPQGETSICTLDNLRTLIEDDKVGGPRISEEELKARGKSDWVVKIIAVLQIIWFVVQTLLRAIQHYQITALEIMTVALVFCSIFVYGFCWNQPQNVEYPVLLEIRDVALAPDQATSKQDSDKSNHAGEQAEPAIPTRRLERVRSGLPNDYVKGWAANRFPKILFTLFACGFGAIHCLAWNSPFPTSKERHAWHICSVTTTALPALVTLVLDHGSSNHADRVALAMLIAVPYIAGRATLIVLALISLRALPADAFQTVSWNNYIPHFAA